MTKMPASEEEIMDHIKNKKTAATPEQILESLKPKQRVLTQNEMDTEDFKNSFYKIKTSELQNLDKYRKPKSKKSKTTRSKKCSCK